MGGPAEKTREGEKNDGPDEVAFPAEHRAEPTRERNDEHAREDVAGRDPSDLIEARTEISHHVRQRDVHDRAVDYLHQRRENDGESDEILVGVPFCRGLSRHDMKTDTFW